MRDRLLILAGLGGFLALVTWPAWRGVAAGSPAPAPALARPPGQTRCVEATDYMRASHMQLLSTWRDRVVRDNVRTYTNADGQVVTMSLTLTCLKCHDDRGKFCDRCHDYAGVKPACWDCHVVPERGPGADPGSPLSSPLAGARPLEEGR